ncbi:MAG: hypothetical protein COU27_02950 [Candidatus Levybacteria bacterium CG10_big_fil_rev_8_21_14_0_10_36_7]|nr:MAG: hypothetical protein COU27_02950 [Candidatus Levybacteria bacterium CG10_big_fil_rev_8_21_14_0_10_36_7]
MTNNKVAVINSNDDIVESISMLLADSGYIPVSGHIYTFRRGQKDVLEFFQKHKPAAVIWDIAPPYESNWNFLQLIRKHEITEGIPFVITTTNKKELGKIAGEGNFIEILGKPEDMSYIVENLKKVIVR